MAIASELSTAMALPSSLGRTVLAPPGFINITLEPAWLQAQLALIVEAGAAPRFDRLVVVTCRPEQRVQRFAQRLKLDSDTARMEVNRRMAAQIPDEEKSKLADYVIDNSGSLDATEKQVREVYGRLKQEAEKSP